MISHIRFPTSGLSSSPPIQIKKEPISTPVPAPVSVKKKSVRVKKDKPDGNSREARTEGLRRKFPHALVELGISLVPGDIRCSASRERGFKGPNDFLCWSRSSAMLFFYLDL